jgi:hypothetical protein
VSPQPKENVEPVKAYVPSAELHTTIRRVVGYRACCNGEPVGPTRGTYADARKDLSLHKLEHALASS